METAISNFWRRWYDQQSVTWLVGTGIGGHGGCKTVLLSQLPTARISKTVSPRIIQPSSHQSRNTHRLAISLPRFESFGFPFLGSGSTACSPRTARYYRSPHPVCVSLCSNLWQRDYQESFKKCSEESQAMFPCQWRPLPAPPQIEATEAFLQCVFWCSLVIK